MSITLLYTQLCAERITITKTSKKSNLSKIKQQLDKLHIKMYFKKSNSSYIVYSQDFSTQMEAQTALYQVRKSFHTAYINKKMIKSEKKVVIDTKPINYNFFVTIGLGSSSYTTQESTGASHSIGGSNYFIEGGYCFNDYSFISFNYLDINSDGGELSNITTAINLNYSFMKNTNIYTGLLLGFSNLTLNLENSTSASSPTAGALVGLSYDILGYIPISLTYQYIVSGLSIKYPNNITVDFTPIQNINLGIGYRF